MGQQIKSGEQKEKVVLFSDRTLYIAGEQILFSAIVTEVNESVQSGPDRILYSELVTPDGIRLSGGKHLILNSEASGNLSIPADATTGIYYLRAYTKFMRNRGPGVYTYIALKIINAGKNEVQALYDNNKISSRPDSESFIRNTEGNFKITTDKLQYSFRDTVRFSIKDTGEGSSSWKELSMTVIPEFSMSSDQSLAPESGKSQKDVYYFPEPRGLSVTGKVTAGSTGIPLPGIMVNLSIIGKGRDFMAVHTDSAGRFFFSLPDYTGYRDLFLCTENISTSIPRILVDNDYCTIPVHIPSYIFSLSQNEREAAYKMAVNMQLGSFYKSDSIPGSADSTGGDKSFYGKPDEILYIDKYIQLPTLEEYFNGLPNSVKVRKRQGQKYFKVIGTQSGLAFFDPLILVDLVAIDDPERVLAIPPANISRIEIVKEVYVKGDQTYGGVVNIISKHGDFAGIDLPSSGIFINYGFLDDGGSIKESNPLPPHSPDTRNTLYWQPQLHLDKDRVVTDSFLVSDTPGRYLIVLNVVNAKGEVFKQSSVFEVKK
jgi:hypothetical protein